jgi:hypothetical protein
VHFDPSYVSHLTSGRSTPSRKAAALFDEALGAEGSLVACLPDPALMPGRHSHSQGQPVMPHFGPFRLVPCADAGLPDLDATAMQAFRVADRRAGGGGLYGSVVSYLASSVAPRLFGAGGTGPAGRGVFAAAGALTEMAGWMAHDAGSDASAGSHFQSSLALAEVSGDRQLTAHVLGSLSHLAAHRDQGEQAVEHARRGRSVLRGGPRAPRLQARLFALEARGCALLNDSARCTALLRRAERALAAPQEEPASPWVSGFDEGSLASEAGRCMRQLGDLGEARRLAQRIVVLRPGDRARSRAFGQLLLASVLISQGEPEQACALGRAVIEATATLGSVLVIRQLVDLKPQLAPYRTTAAVAEFGDCLNEALLERQWLYRFLHDGPR